MILHGAQSRRPTTQADNLFVLYQRRCGLGGDRLQAVDFGYGD